MSDHASSGDELLSFPSLDLNFVKLKRAILHVPATNH